MEKNKRDSETMFNAKKCILTAIPFSLVSALLYAFMLGLIAIPIAGIGSSRMIPITFADIIFIPIISIGVGALVVVYVYRSDNITSSCNKKLSVGYAGVTTGFVTSICPLCNILLFSLIGASFTFFFLSPFIFELRILSIVLMLVSAFVMLRDVRSNRLAQKR
jgi:hypothetical protein